MILLSSKKRFLSPPKSRQHKQQLKLNHISLLYFVVCLAMKVKCKTIKRYNFTSKMLKKHTHTHTWTSTRYEYLDATDYACIFECVVSSFDNRISDVLYVAYFVKARRIIFTAHIICLCSQYIYMYIVHCTLCSSKRDAWKDRDEFNQNSKRN